MARIRTIKPEFFRHEALQDLESDNHEKYPMLVFVGIWCLADREGRFLWRPRLIKLDVLPFLEFNMEETLNLLVAAGFIRHYSVEGIEYGAITNWDRHQIVGRDEPPSEIPTQDGAITLYFRPLTQTERFKVYERDGWTCLYCGENLRNKKRALCLDHVIPYSIGGSNRAVNLATCCKKCNAVKANKTPDEAGFCWPEGLGEAVKNNDNRPPVNGTSTGGQVASDPPLLVVDKEREGEREGEREVELKAFCSEPKKPDSEPEPAPPVLVIPLMSKKGCPEKVFNVTQMMIDDWAADYPAVDVLQEIRNLRQWNIANPTRRKYEKGILRHINAWLMNGQNRGGAANHAQKGQSKTYEHNVAAISQGMRELIEEGAR